MARNKIEGIVKAQLPSWHSGQIKVDSELVNQNFICAHRGWWKSAYMVRKMIEHLITGRDVGWYAPTMDTIRDNWTQIVRAVEGIEGHEEWFKKNDLTFTIPGAATCHFYSLEVEARKRGPSYTLVLGDEAGEWSDTAYMSVVRPIAKKLNGQIILCGTPNVANPNNWWQRILTKAEDNRTRMRSWIIPALGTELIDEVLVPGVSPMTPYCNPVAPFTSIEDMLAEFDDYDNKNSWYREYLCHFIADAGGQFAGIDECCSIIPEKVPGSDNKWIHKDYTNEAIRKYGHYQTGVDIALVGDFTVITVIDQNNNEQVYMHRFRPGSMKEWDQVYQSMIDVQRLFPGPILVDCTNLGASLITTMPQMGVNITPVVFNQKNKAPMLDHLSSMIARGKIKLFNLPVIKQELQDTQRKAMASGVVKIAATGSGVHDDVPLSMCMMVHGVRPLIELNSLDNSAMYSYMDKPFVSEVSPELW